MAVFQQLNLNCWNEFNQSHFAKNNTCIAYIKFNWKNIIESKSTKWFEVFEMSENSDFSDNQQTRCKYYFGMPDTDITKIKSWNFVPISATYAICIISIRWGLRVGCPPGGFLAISSRDIEWHNITTCVGLSVNSSVKCLPVSLLKY